MADVVSWFNAIEEKSACVFTTFDISEFYPSTSQKLLKAALKFAGQSTEITVEEERVIMHASKSLALALQWRQRVGEEEQGWPRCNNREV